MANHPAQAIFRSRVRGDLDDTTDRNRRAAILSDCLIERLIAVTLRDRRDYLGAVEAEIAAKLADPGGPVVTETVARVLSTRRRHILHPAIRDELLKTGLDLSLWRSTLARIDGAAGEAFDQPTLERFLEICELRGWEPPVELASV